MRRIASLGVLAAAVGGCGGADAPTPGPTAAQTDVIAVAEHYAHALAAHDWKAVCATRARAEQQALARSDGTCARGMARVFKDKPTHVMTQARANHVRIKGDRAGVDLAQSNGLVRLGRIGAVREDGHWRIADLPDDQIP